MIRPLEDDELEAYWSDKDGAHLSEANEAAFRAKWEERLREAGLDVSGNPLPTEEPPTNGGQPAYLVAEADQPTEAPAPTEGDEGDEPSPRADLVAIATAGELFATPDAVPFATFEVSGHRETWPVRSSGFREWLSAQFFELTGKSPSGQNMTDALATIAGIAKYRGERRRTYLRLAAHEGAIYVDLADAEWRALEITESGWRVISDPPVRFWRSSSMRPLPEPVAGGNLDELREFINTSDDAWVLLVGWLVMAFSPTGPYPVAVLHGEQGSAKSTVERMLRSLIDPNQSPLRATPKDNQDLLIACKNGWVIAYDNLSHVENWLSDALCRVATGSGMSKRQLYTDSDEVVLDACRPIILNGISSLATRGDLLDRSLLIDLEPIPPESRRTERDLWREFEAVRPRIMGALLDGVCAALRNRDEVQATALARMADFEVCVTAAEEGLGWRAGTFRDAYQENRRNAHDIALEASMVGGPLLQLLEASGGSWTGTAADLLDRLSTYADDRTARSSYWPRNAWAMSNQINRLAPNLRAVGFVVERTRSPGGNRERLITLRFVGDGRDGRVAADEGEDSAGAEGESSS